MAGTAKAGLKNVAETWEVLLTWVVKAQTQRSFQALPLGGAAEHLSDCQHKSMVEDYLPVKFFNLIPIDIYVLIVIIHTDVLNKAILPKCRLKYIWYNHCKSINQHLPLPACGENVVKKYILRHIMPITTHLILINLQ